MARMSRNDAGVATLNPFSTSLSPLPTLHGCEWSGQADKNSPDFADFSAMVRDELAPEGTLETLLADRVALAAWHLDEAARAEREAIARSAHRRGKGHSSRPTRCQALTNHQRAALRAQHALEKSIGLLQALRDRRASRWGRSPHAPAPTPSGPVLEPSGIDVDNDLDDRDFSNEWPVLPRDQDGDDTENELGEPVSDEPALESWRDRLVFDFNVSESSPVVKGTWVTVSHVVTLIVDGWTWGDILRTHPELTAEDVRVCLAYTVAQDNGQA